MYRSSPWLLTGATISNEDDAALNVTVRGSSASGKYAAEIGSVICSPVMRSFLANSFNLGRAFSFFSFFASSRSTIVSAFFASLAPAEVPDTTVTNRRHLDALAVALEGLQAAAAALRASQLDCATIDLRRAWRALGEISGMTIDECIVDRIFERFCLGK